MSFKDNVLEDLDIFLNLGDFAQTVKYTNSSGVSKEIPAIFLIKTDLLLENMNGTESSIPAVIVRKRDLPDVKNGDVFTVNGTSYIVIQTEYKDDLIIKAYLSKDNRPLF